MAPTVLVEAHHYPSQTTGECLLQISGKEEIRVKHIRLFHDNDFDEKTSKFSYEEFLVCVQVLRDTGKAEIASNTHTIVFLAVGEQLTIRITDANNAHEIQEVTLQQLLTAFGL